MDRKRYLKDYLKTYRSEVKCLNLAVPKSEYGRIEKAAHREAKKPGRLVVEIALAEIDRATFVPADILAELKALRFLIRNIANNLNQIAHYTNAVQRAADAQGVMKELQHLERVIAEYTSGRLRERIKSQPIDHPKPAHDHQIDEP